MKRKSIVFVAAVATIFLAAPVALSAAMPASIAQARDNARMGGAVVAVGDARFQNPVASRAAAIASARGGITAALEAIVNYGADLQIDALEVNDCAITRMVFSQTINTVAESRLLGAMVIEEYTASDGRHWAVMAISMANATTEIRNAAETAAQEISNAAGPAVLLNPHFAAAMDAMRRKDEAFGRYFERYSAADF